MLLGVPGDLADGPQHAPIGELAFPEYQGITRPVLHGHGRFDKWSDRKDIDISKEPFGAVRGSSYDTPMLQSYRNGADDDYRLNSICAHGDMGYPSDTQLGGPVFDDFGRLAGVIIGADLGPERGHTGAYVPADFILVAAALAKAAVAAARERGHHSFGIDFVEHQSNDVYWDKEPEQRKSARHGDQMVKMVMPRRAWQALTDAAGPDAPGYDDARAAIAENLR